MKPQNNKKKWGGPPIGVVNVVRSEGFKRMGGDKLKPPSIKNPRQMECTSGKPNIISNRGRKDRLMRRGGEGGGESVMGQGAGCIRACRGGMGNYGESRR